MSHVRRLLANTAAAAVIGAAAGCTQEANVPAAEPVIALQDMSSTAHASPEFQKSAEKIVAAVNRTAKDYHPEQGDIDALVKAGHAILSKEPALSSVVAFVKDRERTSSIEAVIVDRNLTVAVYATEPCAKKPDLLQSQSFAGPANEITLTLGKAQLYDRASDETRASLPLPKENAAASAPRFVTAKAKTHSKFAAHHDRKTADASNGANGFSPVGSGPTR